MSATVIHGGESQNRSHPVGLIYQIGYGVAFQHLKKPRCRFVQNGFQPAGRTQAARLAVDFLTVYECVGLFAEPHNVRYRNVVGTQREGESAATPAAGSQVAASPEVVDHLNQMMAGNGEGCGNLVHGDEAGLTQRGLHEDPEGVIGISAESHWL